MRLATASITLLALAHGLSAQTVADIAKRRSCSPARFVDFPVSLSALGDSATLLSTILSYQPSDTLPPFLLTYSADGHLDTLLQGPDKPLLGPSTDSLLIALRRSLGDSPPGSRPLRAVLRRLPGANPPELALEPVEPTCQPEIVDGKKTLKRLISGLFDLRNDHSRVTPVYAKLSVAFVVYPDSTVGDFRVLQSSKYPHVDSMTIAVLSQTRYAPAIIGRNPKPLWVKQGISFKAER